MRQPQIQIFIEFYEKMGNKYNAKFIIKMALLSSELNVWLDATEEISIKYFMWALTDDSVWSEQYIKHCLEPTLIFIGADSRIDLFHKHSNKNVLTPFDVRFWALMDCRYCIFTLKIPIQIPEWYLTIFCLKNNR